MSSIVAIDRWSGSSWSALDDHPQHPHYLDDSTNSVRSGDRRSVERIGSAFDEIVEQWSIVAMTNRSLVN